MADAWPTPRSATSATRCSAPATWSSRARTTRTTPATASAIVTELNQLIDSIKTDGNTQYAGRYIFSGTATNTQPYQLGATDTYSGNTASITREIGAGVQVAINQPGSSVIGDGSSGLLSTLREIVNDLKSGQHERAQRPPICKRSTPPTTRC